MPLPLPLHLLYLKLLLHLLGAINTQLKRNDIVLKQYHSLAKTLNWVETLTLACRCTTSHSFSRYISYSSLYLPILLYFFFDLIFLRLLQRFYLKERLSAMIKLLLYDLEITSSNYGNSIL